MHCCLNAMFGVFCCNRACNLQSKEKVRKVAYDVLLVISSILGNSSCFSSEVSHQKLEADEHGKYFTDPTLKNNRHMWFSFPCFL